VLAQPGIWQSGPAGATTYAWTIGNGTITKRDQYQTITYTAGASGNVIAQLDSHQCCEL
jgi:hypothetical protein